MNAINKKFLRVFIFDFRFRKYTSYQEGLSRELDLTLDLFLFFFRLPLVFLQLFVMRTSSILFSCISSILTSKLLIFTSSPSLGNRPICSSTYHS